MPSSGNDERDVQWGPPAAFQFAYCTEAIRNAPGMDTAAFLVKLRKRSTSVHKSSDPLADAAAILARISTAAEGQALRRVIEALANMEGRFRESDVYLFSAGTLALVVALIDARMVGLYRQQEWQRVIAG
jgi:hypothetical protein